MNNNQTETSEGRQGSPYCTKTFEVSGIQIQNSYLCNQPRFTISDSWNLLKQKRQFSMK
jgi:hypothetical protein